MGRLGPETRLVKRMRDAAKERYGSDVVIVKYHGDNYSEAGVSDLLICLHGVFLAVEVKAPEAYGGSEERARTEGPTLKQRAFLQRIEKAGGIATVAVSVEEFMAVLDRVARQEIAAQRVARVVEDGGATLGTPKRRINLP